jgi:uncharacterized protein YndB with AHSA1/START domain
MNRKSFTVELLYKASPTIVYKFLTTPDCLIRWYCDECKITESEHYFEWDGEGESAAVLEDIEDEYLKLKLEDSEDDEFLEFKLTRSEVTGDTILEITGFCDDNEVEEEEQFWQTKGEDLRRSMGA